MPTFKEPEQREQEHPLMVDNSNRSIMNVAPAKPESKAAEFYGKLRTELEGRAQAMVGDAGAKLHFDAIVNNANSNAIGAVGRGTELRSQMDQSVMKQGTRVRTVLDEHEKLNLAVMTGNITPELNANYGDLLKSVAGRPKEEQRAKLDEWKRSQLDEIKQIGNEERELIAAKMEDAKKPGVIEHITNSVTTRYMIEFPQSSKQEVEAAIRAEVTDAYDKVHGEVYGPKPLAMK